MPTELLYIAVLWAADISIKVDTKVIAIGKWFQIKLFTRLVDVNVRTM